MSGSNVLIGGIAGASMASIVFAVFFLLPNGSPGPEEIVSNGHVPSTMSQRLPAQSETFTLVEIFERSEPGVVRVNVERAIQITGVGGVGSGFVYDKSGHVITNAHVIENARKIQVTFLDGRSYDAETIGMDKNTDIAVIRVDADPATLVPLTLGNSASLKVGEQVAAIGNPFGLSGSMTSGIVSQLDRLLPSDGGFSIPDIIQTDAAINPGNSGGPLLNMRGEIVGINTAIQSPTGDFTGVGFAVPSQTVKKIVPSLIVDGAYAHPWIGVSGQDINPDMAKALKLSDTVGFMVQTVVGGSPASKAGLRGADSTVEFDGREYMAGGDIILSVDGIDVRKIDDILIHLQREKSVGDEMVLSVLRDGQMTSFTIILEERPERN